MTLVEIMVVIGVLMIILAFCMTVNFNSFTSSTLQAEEAKIVSALERARSHAMANMFESEYGVCYISPNYVIFRESEGTCNNSEPTNELIPANTNLSTLSNFSTNFDDSHAIIFNQLSGNRNTVDDTIIITDGIKSEPIEINDTGRINW